MNLLPEGWLYGRWGWLVVTGATLVTFMLVVVVLALAGVHPAADLDQGAIAGYAEEQCERLRTGSVLVQVANFWSNVIYVAVGLLVALRGEALNLRIVGGVLVFLGISSAWFHGFKTDFGQTLDIAGVYAVLLVIIALGVVEALSITEDWVVWTIIGGAAALGVVAGILRTDVGLFNSDIFTPLLAAIVYVGMGLVVILGFPSADRRGELGVTLAVTTGLGALALVFKFTDGTDNGPLADHGGMIDQCLYGQDSLLQGHAMWHIFSGLMFLGMVEFFRAMGNRSASVLR